MGTTLLIGNGLNLCLKHSISWGKLLEVIAEKYQVEYNGHIAMPLEFESILNQILRIQKSPTPKLYDDVKKMVAEKVKDTKLPDNAIHHQLQLIHPDAIMTTNYDNLLEYTYNSEYLYKGDARKTYLFDCTSKQQGVPFYHIHGSADIPKSICLGYEHYMGVVENLRREINTKAKRQAEEMRICQALRNPDNQKHTWYERFYTDDISIVGLGLNESETDLWWLLTHRASLYYSNYCDIRAQLNNRITYYDIVDLSEVEKTSQKRKIHYMLRNAHVKVKEYTLGADCIDYEEGYHMIFEEIKRQER